jgi:hypothetical protein
MSRTTRRKRLAERCVALVHNRLKTRSPYRHDVDEIRDALHQAHAQLGGVAIDGSHLLLERVYRRRLVRLATQLALRAASPTFGVS